MITRFLYISRTLTILFLLGALGATATSCALTNSFDDASEKPGTDASENHDADVTENPDADADSDTEDLNRITIDETEVTLFAGDDFEPAIAFFDARGQPISLDSLENPGIALVSSDEAVVAAAIDEASISLSAKSAGAADITVTFEGDSATIAVEVVRWKQIEAAGYERTQGNTIIKKAGFSCGLLTNGLAYCWGLNDLGQLGIGSFDAVKATPTLVAGDHKFESLSLGFDHACGLDFNGKAYCWGDGADGQLGNGSATNSRAPVAVLVENDESFVQIAAAESHTCARSSAGEISCWGLNANGQLGQDDYAAPLGNYMQPTVVIGTYKAMTVGANHTCAINTQSQIKCWGRNDFGQLGNDHTANAFKPESLGAGMATTRFSEVAAGSIHTCALDQNATLYCWGDNMFYQVIDDGSSNSQIPVQISTAPGIPYEYIVLGGESSCGVSTSKDAYCWGYSGAGNLGDGDTWTYQNEHLQVAGDHAWSQLSLAAYHTCGVTSDPGEPGGYCWGLNEDGALGTESTNASITPSAIARPVLPR